MCPTGCLSCMGKPPHSVYAAFTEKYKKLNKEDRHEPVSGTLSDVLSPGKHLKGRCHTGRISADPGLHAGTGTGLLSNAVYHFHLHVLYRSATHEPWNRYMFPKIPTKRPCSVRLIQYRNPANYDLVKEALEKTHRTDLIGYGPKCLIRPEKFKTCVREQGSSKGEKGRTPNGKTGRKTIRNVHKKKGGRG